MTSASDIINYLRKSNLDRAERDRIISALHQAQPELKGDPKKIKVMNSPHIRRKTSSIITSGGTLNSTQNREKTLTNTSGMIARDNNSMFKSNHLVQTVNGTITPVTEQKHKFGGGAETDGNSYMTVANETVFNPSNAITLACWAYFPPNLSTIRYFFNKGTSVNTPYGLRRTATDGLSIRIRTDNAGGTNYDSSITSASIPDNTWMSIVATWSNSSNLVKIYKDAVLNGTGTATVGNLVTTNTDPLALFALSNGANKMALGTRLSWVHLFNSEWSQTDVNDFHAGIINRKNNNMIIAWPFIQDIQMRSRATSGLFLSKT